MTKKENNVYIGAEGMLILGCSLQDQMSLGYDALEQKESAIYNMLLMINARIWETVMEGAPIHVRFWKADSKLRRYS